MAAAAETATVTAAVVDTAATDAMPMDAEAATGPTESTDRYDDDAEEAGRGTSETGGYSINIPTSDVGICRNYTRNYTRIGGW